MLDHEQMFSKLFSKTILTKKMMSNTTVHWQCPKKAHHLTKEEPERCTECVYVGHPFIG